MMTTNKYNVIPGAEAFYLKGNEVGILLIHGFVGTPQSIKFIGKQLNDKGFTVMAPRLKGHGTHYKELEDATFTDWLEELEFAYQQLKQICSHVFIAGQSMGGALSLLLATKLNPSGVIAINAAFSVPGYESFKNENDLKYIQEGKPDIKDDSVIEITYPMIPIHAVKQLLAIIEMSKSNLSKVTCPLLLFKSLEDHVVPHENTDFVYSQVSSWQKEIIQLKNSYHVASMDFDKFNIVQHSEAFIANIVQQAAKQCRVS